MLKIRTAIAVAVAALVAAPAATAHVTINPGEWEAGGFARFAVRVPNERDNANVVRVTMRFPENVISASFQPVPGWTRTVQTARLAEPIQEEGEEPITERLATVTWRGQLPPGEFQEFGVSFQVPEDAPVGEPLLFPTLQEYSSGEVSRWISPDEEADEPAPRVMVLASEEEGGVAGAAAEEEPESQTAEAAPAATSDDDDDGSGLATVALVLGIAGLAAGLAALAITLMRPRRA